LLTAVLTEWIASLLHSVI